MYYIQRKGYELIAGVFRSTKPLKGTDYSDTTAKVSLEFFMTEMVVWLRVVHKMADMLAADNPRFDRKKFLAACGIEE